MPIVDSNAGNGPNLPWAHSNFFTRIGNISLLLFGERNHGDLVALEHLSRNAEALAKTLRQAGFDLWTVEAPANQGDVLGPISASNVHYLRLARAMRRRGLDVMAVDAPWGASPEVRSRTMAFTLARELAQGKRIAHFGGSYWAQKVGRSNAGPTVVQRLIDGPYPYESAICSTIFGTAIDPPPAGSPGKVRVVSVSGRSAPDFDYRIDVSRDGLTATVSLTRPLRFDLE